MALQLLMRQSQSLVITPQLMQAIRLLQMSAGEVSAFVDAEIETNPLLSRREEPSAPDNGPADPEAGGRDAEDRNGPGFGRREALVEPGTSWRGGAEFRLSDWGGEARDPLANLRAATSLVSHVDAQITAAFPSSLDRCIARHFLAALDPCGYLTAAPDEVAAALGVDGARAARVLAGCQELEPTGLFARSLAECLALQLAESDRLDPAMRTLLDHLPLVAEGRFGELRLACGVDQDDLADMLAELRALDPKPGLSFDTAPVPSRIPDVTVRAGHDGWIVELNDETLPRILVDRTYRAELGARDGGETARFLSDCMQRASWLTRSLDQRANTILKVATEIVRHQTAFLDEGVSGLKPLNLRMVAERIGMHESTVSRAVANKHMATPRGMFALKFFFSSGLADADGGGAHSAEAVKHRIRALIDNERPEAVLSDDAIVALLVQAGIVIARRTVAKYRDMLGLPSSARRRRDKRRAIGTTPAA